MMPAMKRVLKWGAILLLALAVVFVGWRVWMRWRLESKLAELRNAGAPLTLAELDKWYDYPPADQNGALVVTNALGKITQPEGEEWVLLEGQRLVNGVRIRPEEDRLQLARKSYLPKNVESLRLLRQSSGYLQFRYPSKVEASSLILGPQPSLELLGKY
jgi:hypothetical protein